MQTFAIPRRFSRRDLTRQRNRNNRCWPPARQAFAKLEPFEPRAPSAEDRWFHGRPVGTSRRVAGNLSRPALFVPLIEVDNNMRRVLFQAHNKQQKTGTNNRRAALECQVDGDAQPPAHPDPCLLGPAYSAGLCFVRSHSEIELENFRLNGERRQFGQLGNMRCVAKGRPVAQDTPEVSGETRRVSLDPGAVCLLPGNR
jgi:hypothetical protein